MKRTYEIDLETKYNQQFQQALESFNIKGVMYLVEMKRYKIVQDIVDIYKIHNKNYSLPVITQQSHLEVVKYLLRMPLDQTNRKHIIYYFLRESIKHSRLYIIDYLVKLMPDLDQLDNSLLLAAAHGQLPVIKYLIDLIPYLDEGDYAFLNAVRNGDLGMIKIIAELKSDLSTEDDVFLSGMMASDDLEISNCSNSTSSMDKREFVFHLRVNCAFILAARDCKLEIMQYLIELTSDVDQKEKMIHISNDYPAIIAVRNGNLETLQYLIESTSDSVKRELMLHRDNNILFQVAMGNSDYKILKYLIALISDATQKDRLIHIQDDGLALLAVKHCDLQMLQYLVESTPDSVKRDYMLYHDHNILFRVAAKKGNLAILKYLIELTPDLIARSIMICALENEAVVIAAKKGYMEILRYLIGLMPDQAQKDKLINVLRNKVFFKVARHNSLLEVLKYLIELAPMKSDKIYTACKQAIQNGKVDIVRYLVKLLPATERDKLMMDEFLSDLSIEMAEYLASAATCISAILFVKKNLTISLSYQAIERNAVHTLWYSLDCEVSKRVFQCLKVKETDNKVSVLMYLSFLSGAVQWMKRSELGRSDCNILKFLGDIKIPLIVKDNLAKSLLILDRMLLPVTYLYRVCKDRDQFGIFSLPSELMQEILWINISEGITDLLPEKEYYLNVLGDILKFYLALGKSQIALGLDNDIPDDNTSYALSFLCSLEKYIVRVKNEKNL